MIYIFIATFGIFLTFFILVWIRKTLWDAVHRNLLDFEDQHKGQVARRNIFNPPIFSGHVDDIVTTINFSSAREGNKRVNYINISMEINTPFSFSITRKEWLKTQEVDPIEDFLLLENENGIEFVLRPASNNSVKKLVKETDVISLINSCEEMSYVYFGPTGILFEQTSEELLKDTEYETIIIKIKQIIKLGKKLNGN
jgi:hypothetical protein